MGISAKYTGQLKALIRKRIETAYLNAREAISGIDPDGDRSSIRSYAKRIASNIRGQVRELNTLAEWLNDPDRDPGYSQSVRQEIQPLSRIVNALDNIAQDPTSNGAESDLERIARIVHAEGYPTGAGRGGLGAIADAANKAAWEIVDLEKALKATGDEENKIADARRRAEEKQRWAAEDEAERRAAAAEAQKRAAEAQKQARERQTMGIKQDDRRYAKEIESLKKRMSEAARADYKATRLIQVSSEKLAALLETIAPSRREIAAEAYRAAYEAAAAPMARRQSGIDFQKAPAPAPAPKAAPPAAAPKPKPAASTIKAQIPPTIREAIAAAFYKARQAEDRIDPADNYTKLRADALRLSREVSDQIRVLEAAEDQYRQDVTPEASRKIASAFASLRGIVNELNEVTDDPSPILANKAKNKIVEILKIHGFQGPSSYQAGKKKATEERKAAERARKAAERADKAAKRADKAVERARKAVERSAKKQAAADKRSEAPFRRKWIAGIERARKALAKASDPAVKEIPSKADLAKLTTQDLSDWHDEITERARGLMAPRGPRAKEEAAQRKEAAKQAREANKAAEKARKAAEKASKAAERAAAKAASKEASKAEKKAAAESARKAKAEAKAAEEKARIEASDFAKLARTLQENQLSEAQKRTAAMFQDEAPAPAPEGVKYSRPIPSIPFTMDALLLASEADAKQLISIADKNQRRALRLGLLGELKILRRQIKELRAARKGRLAQIRAQCREAAKRIRRKMIELRQEFLRQWGELKAEDKARRASCSTDASSVLAELNPAIKAAQERAARALGLKYETEKYKKGPTPQQLTAARKRREALEESDQMVAFDLAAEVPGAEKWWIEKGSKMRDFKPSALEKKKKSRTEAALEYLAENPGILDDFYQAKAAAELRAKEREEAKLSKEYERKKVQREARASKAARSSAPTRRITGRIFGAGRRRDSARFSGADVPF